MSMVPLANQQVASMRRELEAEHTTTSFIQDNRAGRAHTPQMGYTQHGSEYWALSMVKLQPICH